MKEKNITHQQNPLTKMSCLSAHALSIPISDDEVAAAPFYRPDENSPEMHIRERMRALGGSVPSRSTRATGMPPANLWDEFEKASGDRMIATTMAFVAVLRKLLQDKGIGPYRRLFPMRHAHSVWIHCSASLASTLRVGQLYEPVDKDVVSYYKEAQDGQIPKKVSRSRFDVVLHRRRLCILNARDQHHSVFRLLYVGMQRIGDLAWLAGDMRVKGFMVGGTAGRPRSTAKGCRMKTATVISAYPVPNMMAYDPAFAYEIAVIIRGESVECMLNRKMYSTT